MGCGHHTHAHPHSLSHTLTSKHARHSSLAQPPLSPVRCDCESVAACRLWPVACRLAPSPSPSPSPIQSLSLSLSLPSLSLTLAHSRLPPSSLRSTVRLLSSFSRPETNNPCRCLCLCLCLDVSATATALNSPLPSPPIQHVANFLSFANPDSHRIPIPDPYRP